MEIWGQGGVRRTGEEMDGDCARAATTVDGAGWLAGCWLAGGLAGGLAGSGVCGARVRVAGRRSQVAGRKSQVASRKSQVASRR